MLIRKEEALEYHASEPAGKVSVTPTKPCRTQRDLSLAYTPGVAVPCLEIFRDPALVYNYTSKGNLVGVVSNGTAVLGLGNIGALAGKPVMEGKAVLFKKFAGIDVFDIEVDAQDPDRFCDVVAALEPTFGAINLEDIKAPECFAIEAALRARMGIPVFHDDQHGTATVVYAALLNALRVVGKEMKDVRVCVLGVGAAGVAISKLLLAEGVGDLVGVNRHGIISEDDDRLDSVRHWLAANTNKEKRTGDLSAAMTGADVFIGVSGSNLVTEEQLKLLAPDSIIFALANPDPEVDPALARRYAAIVATGRSDEPNQINNVLAFPGIFRGLLDVGATAITEEIEIAAGRAIADVVKESELSKDYIVPTVFNASVVKAVAAAVEKVARASMQR